jgi:hypothetical protein
MHGLHTVPSKTGVECSQLFINNCPKLQTQQCSGNLIQMSWYIHTMERAQTRCAESGRDGAQELWGQRGPDCPILTTSHYSLSTMYVTFAVMTPLLSFTVQPLSSLPK